MTSSDTANLEIHANTSSTGARRRTKRQARSRTSLKLFNPDVIHFGYELTRNAIDACCRHTMDAHTVEDAVRCHSEILDLLSIEAMIVRISARPDARKTAMLRRISKQAEYHRDVIDRLTDIVEHKQQLIWKP
jgi:hypothetical protein